MPKIMGLLPALLLVSTGSSAWGAPANFAWEYCAKEWRGLFGFCIENRVDDLILGFSSEKRMALFEQLNEQRKRQTAAAGRKYNSFHPECDDIVDFGPTNQNGSWAVSCANRNMYVVLFKQADTPTVSCVYAKMTLNTSCLETRWMLREATDNDARNARGENVENKN